MIINDSSRLIEALKFDEGSEKYPYECTAGKISIGVGYNLTDNGLPQHIIDELLGSSIIIAIDDAKKVFQSFGYLNEVRQAVLVNMAYNLGRARLAGFKRMIRAINNLDYPDAAFEMLDSRWADQVGKRAKRLALEMRTGEYQELK